MDSIGFARVDRGNPCSSEPALAVPVRAAVAVETVTVEVVHTALHHAVHAALHEVAARAVFAAAERAAVAGQHGEAPLLALVQGLVERIGGIGGFFQGRRRRPPVLRALAPGGGPGPPPGRLPFSRLSRIPPPGP